MFVHPYHQHINGSFIHVINTSTVPSSTPSTHQRSVHPHPSTHQHCQHFNASFIYTINTSTVRTISIPIPSTLQQFVPSAYPYHQHFNSSYHQHTHTINTYDVPFVEFIYLVFSRTPGWSHLRRFRSLLLCSLSVERCCFPLFVDSTQAL